MGCIHRYESYCKSRNLSECPSRFLNSWTDLLPTWRVYCWGAKTVPCQAITASWRAGGQQLGWADTNWFFFFGSKNNVGLFPVLFNDITTSTSARATLQRQLFSLSHERGTSRASLPSDELFKATLHAALLGLVVIGQHCRLDVHRLPPVIL